MNFTKNALILSALLVGINAQASEVSTALLQHLTRDTAGIVKSYAHAGEISLNPSERVGRFDDTNWGLSEDQMDDLTTIFRQLYTSEPLKAVKKHMDRDSATIVVGYLHDDHAGMFETRKTTSLAPVTYTSLAKGIPAKTLLPIAPRIFLSAAKNGDTIVINSSTGQHYDFELREKREDNLKKVAQWRGIILPSLLAKGFTGSHTQMLRFMANTRYFDMHIDSIAQAQQKEAAELSDDKKWDLENWNKNLDWVVRDKKDNP